LAGRIAITLNRRSHLRHNDAGIFDTVGANRMSSEMERDTSREMIWPETGLHTLSRIPPKEKNELNEDDTIELTIDFLTLSLTPTEFIQLASFLRMTVDDLLEQHPSYQRTVINAFDIRD